MTKPLNIRVLEYAEELCQKRSIIQLFEFSQAGCTDKEGMDEMERLVKADLVRAERVRGKDDLRGIFVKDLTDQGRSYLERWRRENTLS